MRYLLNTINGPFPHRWMWVFIITFAVSMLLLPSGTAQATFGDNPHTYGQVLVYDNITTNPAPQDFWNGGYNGYPGANGIQLSPGMYLARADFIGTAVSARIYEKADIGLCSDNNAGITLSPDNIGAPDAGYFAVQPVDGANTITTTVCTAIYINWNTGVSVRLRIYRVFPGVQVDQVTNSFQGEYPVDGLGGQLDSATAFYFEQTLDVVAVPFTVTLDIDWRYRTTGTYLGALDDDPDSVTNSAVPGANCVYITPPPGSEPVGADRVCPGETVVLDHRLGTYHFRISGHETLYAYIFRLAAFQGAGFPTPTPTASPTPNGTPTPTLPAACAGGWTQIVDLQADGGSDITFVSSSLTHHIYAEGGTIYIVANGSAVRIPDYATYPGAGFVLLAQVPPLATGIYHLYATENAYPTDPALIRVCPPVATVTPSPTVSLPTCSITNFTQITIPQSPNWQIIPMELNYIIFSVNNTVYAEYPYNSSTYEAIPFAPVRWSTIGTSGWFRFHSETAPASLAICNPPPATATSTVTPSATGSATASSTPTGTLISTPTAPSTNTPTTLPTSTPTAPSTNTPLPTPGGGFPSPLPTINVLAPTAPPSNVGPMPDLGIVVPTLRPLLAVTITVQISVTDIFSGIQQIEAGIQTPAAQIRTITAGFTWDSGEQTASSWISIMQPGLDWLAILNPANPAYDTVGGPLWALAPVLRPLLPIIITTMLVSFLRLLLWVLGWLLHLVDLIIKLIELIPGE